MKRHHQNLTCLSWLLVLLINGSVLAQDDARIVEWVEDAPVSDNTRIALGYPVPQPVDTPLPFDGFRSYAGLDMRHRELEATTPWVHGEEVGHQRCAGDLSDLLEVGGHVCLDGPDSITGSWPRLVRHA